MSIHAFIFVMFSLVMVSVLGIGIIIHVWRENARMERELGKDVWRNGKAQPKLEPTTQHIEKTALYKTAPFSIQKVTKQPIPLDTYLHLYNAFPRTTGS